MDRLDATILSDLEAASIDEKALTTLSREDLKDLFPGTENFLKRKQLWDLICQMQGPTEIATLGTSDTTGTDVFVPSTGTVSVAMPPCSPLSRHDDNTTEKKMKMPNSPEYVVYTDYELEIVRSLYFSLLRKGKDNFKMSKELCCRLVRNTIISMVAILRASPMGKEATYPSKLEIRAMSQKMVDYYPMLRDADQHMPYLTIYTKMYKRLQNIKSPRKKQGPMPQRGKTKKTLFDSENSDSWTEGDISSDNIGSNQSTVLLESNDDLSEDNQSDVHPPKRSRSVTLSSPVPGSTRPSSSPVPSSSRPPSSPVPGSTRPSSSPVNASTRPSSSPVNASTRPALQTSQDDADSNMDSLKVQARHYKTLNNMYKKANSKPNPTDVAQVLNLEFKARRAFIDANLTREEDRPAQILDTYPYFKEIRHAMDELSRIVGGTNMKFIDEVKARWSGFCTKAQFYGIWKKALKPPLPVDIRGVDFIITLVSALPAIFPSAAMPPKKLGPASEALLHVLKPGEDPALYLGKRPLSSPVLLFDGTTCIVAVGETPLNSLPKDEFCNGLLVLMAYYYTLHLTYPKCIATVLSVIQTEVICDTIHEQDATSAYKKAMAEWKSFFE